MPEAVFQYLVLVWLTVLTLPWAALALWAFRGGPQRLFDDTLAALRPCGTCGGGGFILDAEQGPVTCPDCEGWRPPPGGGAGPPHMRAP